MWLNRVIISAICLLAGFSFSSFHALEPPEDDALILLKIARSKDSDEVWHKANLTLNASIDTEKPILAFWYRKAHPNKTEPLAWVQNKYAYGIRVLQPFNSQSKNMKFQLAGYSEETFELRQVGKSAYKVFITIANEDVAVSRIFVQFEDAAPEAPTIAYVELSGYNYLTAQLVAKTITPR
jgi:hypothetical protein